MNASKPMKVRVTPAEAELIRAAAAGSQKTVATWIRDTVIDAVEQGDTEFNASWVNAQDREQLPYRLPASAALMRRLDRLRNGTPLALWVRYLVVDRARRALAEPTEEAKATGTNG